MWADDLREGLGAAKYPNGNTFTGQFHNDQPNGFGIKTFADGSRAEGEWRNAKSHGIQRYYYANDDYEDCFFINNLEEGPAMYTRANGQMMRRVYQFGEIVEEELLPN
jgi:hypothetical protein